MLKTNIGHVNILLAAPCYLCKGFTLFSNNNNWSFLCGR